MVNGYSQRQIIMVTYGESFQKGVNAKTDEQQPWNLVHFCMAMYVAVFGSLGEKFQYDLEQNTHHYENTDVMVSAFVHFWE